MTTHGSRKTNAHKSTADEAVPQTETSDGVLDLDAWLAKRMLDERSIRVSGKIFRFTGSGTPEQAVKFRDLVNADGEVLEALILLLVDPSEAGELRDAYSSQRTPLGKLQQAEFVAAIINHILAGVDLGES